LAVGLHVGPSWGVRLLNPRSHDGPGRGRPCRAGRAAGDGRLRGGELLRLWGGGQPPGRACPDRAGHEGDGVLQHVVAEAGGCWRPAWALRGKRHPAGPAPPLRRGGLQLSLVKEKTGMSETLSRGEGRSRGRRRHGAAVTACPGHAMELGRRGLGSRRLPDPCRAPVELWPPLGSSPPSPPAAQSDRRAARRCLQLPCPVPPSLRPAPARRRGSRGRRLLPRPRPRPLSLRAGEGPSQKMMSITDNSTSWVLPRGCAGAAARPAPRSPRGAAAPLPAGAGGLRFSLAPVSQAGTAAPLALALPGSWRGQSCASLRQALGAYKAEYFLTS